MSSTPLLSFACSPSRISAPFGNRVRQASTPRRRSIEQYGVANEVLPQSVGYLDQAYADRLM